jgi:hypothetical protein
LRTENTWVSETINICVIVGKVVIPRITLKRPFVYMKVIKLACDRFQWRASTTAVMNFQIL